MTSTPRHPHHSAARQSRARLVEARATQRRHGTDLEQAILQAAWDELLQVGYGRLTYDGVARRALTSRTVIYRRWPTLGSLVDDAAKRQASTHPIRVPDTGSLRGDLVALLNMGRELHAQVVALMSMRLANYFEQPARPNNDVNIDATRDVTRDQPTQAQLPTIFLRAQQRGEINVTGVPQRVLNLPGLLMLGDMLTGLRSPTPDDVEAIVDDVFFPLLRAYGALPATPPATP